MKPRTKAPKAEQLGEDLEGELATYWKVGLFQRSVSTRTAYRYRGILLQYQRVLKGAPPAIAMTRAFLGHLRKQGFSASTLRLYCAALRGFHNWRGEQLVFSIKVPPHRPTYVEQELVNSMLELAKEKPRDYLTVRLMYDAGLRRGEVRKLRVRNVSPDALRIRGKGGRDRTIPLTSELARALRPFCEGKGPDDPVLGIGDTAIYRAVKRYGALAGKPDICPHDLRHGFAERLTERGVSLRVVQELLGHESVDTTQVYIGVVGDHLKQAIKLLEPSEPAQKTYDPCREIIPLVYE